MAAPTNSQRIDELIALTSSLNERMMAIRIDLDTLKGAKEETANQILQVNLQFARMEVDLSYIKERLERSDPSERLARVEEGLKHAREKLDQRDSRRFDIIKIILGAIIGGAVAAGYQWLPKVFELRATHRGSPAGKP